MLIVTDFARPNLGVSVSSGEQCDKWSVAVLKEVTHWHTTLNTLALNIWTLGAVCLRKPVCDPLLMALLELTLSVVQNETRTPTDYAVGLEPELVHSRTGCFLGLRTHSGRRDIEIDRV